jgi:predicted RNA-binding Zn-ribbon protein involved in translation (DUF1610 family)
LSCGHEDAIVYLEDHRYKAPQAGDPYDCRDCHWAWQDLNYPGLPEDVMIAINTAVPHCPQCGEVVEQIPFVAHTVHDVGWEPDGRDGTLTSESQEYDELDSQPNWDRPPTYIDNGWQTGSIWVTCTNKHDFLCTRLAWRHHDNTDEWMVLPA